MHPRRRGRTGSRTLWTTVVLGVLALVASLWWGSRGARGPHVATRQDTASAREEATDPTGVFDPAGERREIEPRTASVADASSTSPPGELRKGLLTGVVRDRGEGKGLPGIRVVATRLDEGLAFDETVTDASGAFRFEWEARIFLSSLHACAGSGTAASERTLRSHLGVGERREVDLVVDEGGTLEGRVVDGQGGPVAATVRVWCDGSRGSRFEPARAADIVVDAAPDGTFRVDHAGRAFHAIAVAPGLVCTSGLRGEIGGGERAAGLALVVGEVHEFRGRVVDENDRPIEGARLEVRGSYFDSSDDATPVAGIFRFDPTDLDATSDAAGRFVLGPAPARERNARVNAEHHLETFATLDPRDAETIVVLSSGFGISGRVSGPDGKPVAGAAVRAHGGRASDDRTLTDEQGRFELRALAPTEDAFVLVDAAGFALLVRQPVPIGADGSGFLELVLEPELRLAGRVVDERGQPVADALVRAIGERIVRFEADFGEKTTVEWSAGRDRVHTGADGTFVLDRLYPGTFELQASPPDAPALRAIEQVRAGREDLEILLDRSSMERVVFAGRVFDALSREPIEAFTVSPMKVGDTASFGTNHEVYDPEGGFRLAGFEEGTYALTVRASGYATWHGARLELAEGEHRQEIALAPSRSILLGVCKEAVGNVSFPARVEFFDRDGNRLWVDLGTSGSTNSVSLHCEPSAVSGLPAAPVTVVANAAGFHERRVELHLLVAPVDPVTIELEPIPTARFECLVLETTNAEVQGHLDGDWTQLRFPPGSVRFPLQPLELECRREDGTLLERVAIRPLDGERFEVEVERTDWVKSDTSANPSFTLELPLDDVRLRVHGTGYETLEFELDLREGRSAPLAVVLLRSGSR